MIVSYIAARHPEGCESIDQRDRWPHGTHQELSRSIRRIGAQQLPWSSHINSCHVEMCPNSCRSVRANSCHVVVWDSNCYTKIRGNSCTPTAAIPAIPRTQQLPQAFSCQLPVTMKLFYVILRMATNAILQHAAYVYHFFDAKTTLCPIPCLIVHFTDAISILVFIVQFTFPCYTFRLIILLQ